MNKKKKAKRRSAQKKEMPERIPDSPENIMWAQVTATPKQKEDWRYLKEAPAPEVVTATGLGGVTGDRGSKIPWPDFCPLWSLSYIILSFFCDKWGFCRFPIYQNGKPFPIEKHGLIRTAGSSSLLRIHIFLLTNQG